MPTMSGTRPTSCPTRAALRPPDIVVYKARMRVASGGYWRWVAAWLWQQRHGQHEHQSEQAGGKERKHEPEAQRHILCRPRPQGANGTRHHEDRSYGGEKDQRDFLSRDIHLNLPVAIGRRGDPVMRR